MHNCYYQALFSRSPLCCFSSLSSLLSLSRRKERSLLRLSFFLFFLFSTADNSSSSFLEFSRKNERHRERSSQFKLRAENLVDYLETELKLSLIFGMALLVFLICLILFPGSTDAFTSKPTRMPSPKPTANPTGSPKPTMNPTCVPTFYPAIPTRRPRTQSPSLLPSSQPSTAPTLKYVASPKPSSQPSNRPSSQPRAVPSRQPSSQPTSQPSRQPSSSPSNPTGQPSMAPVGSSPPSSQPSTQPTSRPSVSKKPSQQPTIAPSTASPTARPTPLPSTFQPTRPTPIPTATSTLPPTLHPTHKPTTLRPSMPTFLPSSQPSLQPSNQPSSSPSRQPFRDPSSQPSAQPTTSPTKTRKPALPTSQPSRQPSKQPSSRPSARPSVSPDPTKLPTGQPSSLPSQQPAASPSTQPTRQPSSQPSNPSGQPTRQPSRQPTAQPFTRPTSQPSRQPSRQPSSQPSAQPSNPSSQPTRFPSAQPSSQPTERPIVSRRPSPSPTSQPSGLPSAQPATVPTSRPSISSKPTSRPTAQPIPKPTSRPSFEDYTLGGFTQSPTAFFRNIGIDGTVRLTPSDSEPCLPVEIEIKITFGKALASSSAFDIAAPGITTGACYTPENGASLAGVNVADASVNPSQAVFPTFSISYTEGSYSNNFAGSKFSFLVAAGSIDASKEFTFILDRSNGFRKSCSLNTSWLVSVEPANKQKGVSGGLDLYPIESYPKKCQLYYSMISYDSPYQQFTTSINITTQIGFNFGYDTLFEIALPGFTNSKGDYALNNYNVSRDYADLGYSRQLSNMTWSTNISWIGYWVEGDYQNYFSNSKIQLFAKGYYGANEKIWINIPKSSNNIVPLCGHQLNNTEITLKVNSTYYYSEAAPFLFSGAIGAGCDDISKCNGHGACDYCSSTCKCFDGYGSERDRSFAIANDFNVDCSSRACPVGSSIASLFDYTVDRRGPVSAHPLKECSSNGVCDRSTGICNCSEGFTGANCQRMTCGPKFASASGVLETCSGRGRCLSMKQLSRAYDALPLSDDINTLRIDPWTFTRFWGLRGQRTLEMFYKPVNFTGVPDEGWDVDFGHTCLCDSSWAVGLRSGETQLAEYFGPQCQYRRCPSGDDPHTSLVDETNCTGKIQTEGGMTAGRAGNICHLDCSNRGVCDFSTGTCKCYSGYGGHNCGIRK
jgi:hypothetical protein